METTKKAATPRPTTIGVTFSNIDYTVDPINNAVTFHMPAIAIPAYDGPVIDRELCEWSREQEIPESVFSDAYDAARTAMFDAISNGLVMQELKKHMKVN